MVVSAVDTGTDELLASVEAGVGTIVLNRPAERNAVTPGMLTGIADLLARFERDSAVGAVLLTGAGGAFCSGGDVSGFAERGGDVPLAGETPEQWCERRLGSQLGIAGRLQAMDIPSVAALPGATAGAGLGIALACDLRVGCQSTVVSTAFLKVGLPGDFGVSWLLSHRLGPSRAARLMLLSERLDGATAAELGVVDLSVPDAEVESEARRVAEGLAAAPRDAVRAIKANLRDAGRLDLPDAMREEVRRYRRCADGEEHRRAVQAFAAARRARSESPA